MSATTDRPEVARRPSLDPRSIVVRRSAAPPAGDVDREAEHVMARVARTFDVATRILPADVRPDVRRLYLVLRTLDDLVDDGDPSAAARIGWVERWADGGPPRDRETHILDDLARRYPGLPRDAVRAFCLGMRADLAGPRHATEADLATYCYQVAGTVGRLMAAVLGTDGSDGSADPEGAGQADLAARALGRAMQRTNILRDLAEDARGGRVYLPDDALAVAGIEPPDAARVLADPSGLGSRQRRALLDRQIALAERDYDVGLAGTAYLRTGRRAVLAAGRMYREILRELERSAPETATRRAVVPRRRKAAIVLRTVLAGR